MDIRERQYKNRREVLPSSLRTVFDRMEAYGYTYGTLLVTLADVISFIRMLYGSEFSEEIVSDKLLPEMKDYLLYSYKETESYKYIYNESRKLQSLRRVLKFSNVSIPYMTFECKDSTDNKKIHIDRAEVDDKLLHLEQYSPQKKVWIDRFQTRNRCIVHLIMDHGLTPLEVSELNIDDVLKDGMLHINGKHDRYIVIEPELHGWIDYYIQEERWQPEDAPEALFVSRKLVRITPSAIQRLIREIFHGLSPRDLRRTAAERILEKQGIDRVTELFGLSTNQASKRLLGL